MSLRVSVAVRSSYFAGARSMASSTRLKSPIRKSGRGSCLSRRLVSTFAQKVGCLSFRIGA